MNAYEDVGVHAMYADRPQVGSWEPALPGAVRERAFAHAVRLGDDLRWAAGSRLGPWLSDGAAGLAVLFAGLKAATGDRGYADPAERYLALAADGVGQRLAACDLGLHRGLTGVVWAECVATGLGASAAPATDDVDEMLASVLDRGWTGPWDLTGGLLGLGVYALERAASDPRLLALVVRCLGQGDCPAPVTGPDLAPLVAFAALAAAAGCAGARPLLARAAGALLADRGDGPVGATVRSAAALALAAPLLGHPLVPQTLTAVLGAVPVDALARVAELGLHHGLAGVCQALHRVAVATGSRRAWDAAGHCGRLLVDRVEGGQTGDGRGLLTGAAGVALALLSLATDVAPVWDRALLLS